MQPSDSLPPVGRGSGRPWPVAYPVPRATRRKKGLPGAWAVLFQRAVGSDPAGCASRRAHRVETAIAFRLHNALGTQNERYFVAVNPTAHSLACLRIGVFVTADAARLATGVGGSPFTGRVSHPLDGKQSFMTSPHRHSPLTSLAWSHRATTPPPDSAAPDRLGRSPSSAGDVQHGCACYDWSAILSPCSWAFHWALTQTRSRPSSLPPKSSTSSVTSAPGGIVKLGLTAVFDAQHGGFTTGWSPVSWGLIDELFVNLIMPCRALGPVGQSCRLLSLTCRPPRPA